MSPFSSRYDDCIRGRDQFTPMKRRASSSSRIPRRAPAPDATSSTIAPRTPRPRSSRITNSTPWRRRAIARCRRPATRILRSGTLRTRRRRLQGQDRRVLRGKFRTPSLRNVAVQQYFMHNGVFSKLWDVIAFYATRDTRPERWYKSGEFDDIPPEYRVNVNVEKAPYNRRRGGTPALDDPEIDAIVAFLGR